MKRERKNEELPLWRKTSPGTLVFRNNNRIKPKQQVRCAVEDLGRFALSDFELLDPGKGEFKVNKSIIKEAVKKAEESRIRTGKAITKKAVKLKDLVPKEQEAKAAVKTSPLPEGDEKYDLVHRGSGKYNVVSSGGKTMNTNLLKKKEAKELKKSLEA